MENGEDLMRLERGGRVSLTGWKDDQREMRWRIGKFGKD